MAELLDRQGQWCALTDQHRDPLPDPPSWELVIWGKLMSIAEAECIHSAPPRPSAAEPPGTAAAPPAAVAGPPPAGIGGVAGAGAAPAAATAGQALGVPPQVLTASRGA